MRLCELYSVHDVGFNAKHSLQCASPISVSVSIVCCQKNEHDIFESIFSISFDMSIEQPAPLSLKRAMGNLDIEGTYAEA